MSTLFPRRWFPLLISILPIPSIVGQMWVQQNSGATVGLNDVCFSDTLRGWVVGYEGTILSTDNGGETWDRQASGVAQDLWGITCIDSDVAYAVGDSGTILSTSNGGETWTLKESGTDYRLWKLSFIDSSKGWIVGSIFSLAVYKTLTLVLYTENGGESWVQLGDTVQGGFTDIQFVSEFEGWMAGTNEFFDNFTMPLILRTTDGGYTWEQQTLPATVGPLRDLYFVDSEYGWATGLGMSIGSFVYYTRNGGEYWGSTGWWVGDTITLPVVFTDVHFCSRSEGWLVGAGDRGIYYSHDGGETWILQTGESVWGARSIFSPECGFAWSVTALGEIWKYTTSSVSVRGGQTFHEGFSIDQNYPNPFNESTAIRYYVPRQGAVVVEVYDVLGRLVKVLVDAVQEAGEYEVTLEEKSFSSGVYFYALRADGLTQVRKMVLVR